MCPDPAIPWGLLSLSAVIGLVLGACVGCGLMAMVAGGATEDAYRKGWTDGTGLGDLDDR